MKWKKNYEAIESATHLFIDKNVVIWCVYVNRKFGFLAFCVLVVVIIVDDVVDITAAVI